ncbi:probable proton-coupled zinc antiporter SLC30A3 [Ostrinia nubilalis]|uniref:probable proton-coupled zinc antiporter SLC30A3 n=1 Tax=Ostrinia nubilalis TaxID=29057 RepID=UPI0030823C2E
MVARGRRRFHDVSARDVLVSAGKTVVPPQPSAKIVDPICTFLFSILVLLTSARVVRDALAMLMQAVPRDFRYRECGAALSALPGVRQVHSLHAWALSTHHVVLSAHVAIDELTDPEQVLQACQNLAKNEFGARAATFQVERYTPAMRACAVCRHAPA